MTDYDDHHVARQVGAGVVAATAGLAIGEIVAAVYWPPAAPLTAVADAVIALAPYSLVRWAIDLFGTADKLVLNVSVIVVVGLCAAAAGRSFSRRPRLANGIVAVLTIIGAAAAVSRPTASLSWVVPSVLTGVVAAFVLRALSWWQPRADVSDDPRWWMRRKFLAVSGGVVVAAVLGGYTARVVGVSRAVESAREDIVLPAASDPAAPLPANADLRIAGLTSWTTPNADFYRIDTALTVPRIDPGDYQLRIFGRVEKELQLSYADLLSRRLIERDLTLSCVSNEIGGGLVGNARWLGVPLAELLDEVRPLPGANQLVGRAGTSDGFTAGAPTHLCRDGRAAMLAIGMNGEPLPAEHGFPVRMIVPGLYGYVSATKWLVELELTSFDDFDAYWIARDWSLPSPIHTASRIDTPRGPVNAGSVTVAGVAWAQHRGISDVEVRVNDGDWHTARLSDEVSDDTWRQWVWQWDAEPGEHTLTVRAIDGDWQTQTAERTPVLPGGATGHHSIQVTVE